MFKTTLLAAIAATALMAPRVAAAEGYANAHLLVNVDTIAPKTHVVTEIGERAFELEGIVLIDVRPAAAFEAGHIPGARQLDPDAVADPNAPVAGALRPVEELARLLGDLGISANSEVVFYDDRGGFHAARMFWLMEYLGHRKARVLNGGLDAWSAAGHKLESGPALPVAKAVFRPALTPRRHASAEYILAHRDDPATLVIDVRPEALFAKGHIPWAKNVPWTGNLEADETMKSPAALTAHFRAAGVTPEANIVVHCQNGLASAHSYLALRLLGHRQVRTYHRSWAEWGTADDLPKSKPTEG